MAERIARIIGLDICGIDIMSPDLTTPIQENGGAVLEVNAGPGFRMHIAPTDGLPRNVAEPVMDMLYPPGSTARIPIIAITGTNGKTTTTRLMAHMVKTMGYKVGFTTTDGIYIQNMMLQKGDCTGPVSAEFVLKDPTVDFAVLETARGGILRAGLGFHTCDIGIVTNIAADHLGLQDIQLRFRYNRRSLCVMARIHTKRVVISPPKKPFFISLPARKCLTTITSMLTRQCGSWLNSAAVLLLSSSTTTPAELLLPSTLKRPVVAHLPVIRFRHSEAYSFATAR